jgi:hypothetical protein
MLEVEDIEDVSCIEDDMEATDRLQSLVQRGWGEGRGDKRTRAEMTEVSSVADGARLWRPPSPVTLRHYLVEALLAQVSRLYVKRRETRTVQVQDHRLLYVLE